MYKYISEYYYIHSSSLRSNHIIYRTYITRSELFSCGVRADERNRHGQIKYGVSYTLSHNLFTPTDGLTCMDI